jgi:hypothetical protein
MWRLALPLLLLGGCAAPPAACGAGEVPVRAITGFFGRQVSSAGAVPRRIGDAEWAAFLREEVTPRFPAGATITAGRGTWRHPGTGATVSEDSAVLLLVVPEAESGAALRGLREAAAAYRRRHQQDSVGILWHRACAAGFFDSARAGQGTGGLSDPSA